MHEVHSRSSRCRVETCDITSSRALVILGHGLLPECMNVVSPDCRGAYTSINLTAQVEDRRWHSLEVDKAYYSGSARKEQGVL